MTVSNVIEGITTSNQQKQNLTAYIPGKKSIAQLVEEPKQRYVLLRRG